MTSKLYNLVTDKQTGDGELYIDGVIDDMKSWWYDTTTPRGVRARLSEVKGNLTVYINSPGGSLHAGADIYTTLREFPGKVTVKVSGVAASAASLIAMAGDEILMSPAAHMLIHNVSAGMRGNQYDMDNVHAQLQEADEGLISVYARKTGKSRDDLLAMMKAETLMSAQTAVDLGFADGILYPEDAEKKPEGTRSMVSLAACKRSAMGLEATSGKTAFAGTPWTSACISSASISATDGSTMHDAHAASLNMGRAMVEGFRAGVEDAAADPTDAELAFRKELETRAKIVLAQMEHLTK